MGSLITAATAVASGEQSGFPAVNAIDGDTTTTRWANGGAGPPAWIYVDLGGVYTVDRVVIVWEFASASTYKIQRATTVGTWTDMATYTVGGNDRTDDTDTLGSFTTGDGRYIRVLSSAHSTGFGLSAYEVSVYGDPAPVDIDIDVTTQTLALTLGHTDVWISPFELTVGQWTQLLAAGDDGSGTAMFGQHLLVDKDDHDVLYAALIANPDGGANTGVYRSINAGATWIQISGLTIGGPDQPVTMAQNVAGDLFVADGVRGTRMGLWVLRKATGLWENPGNFNSVTPVSDCYSVHANPNDRDDLLVSYHSPWGGTYTAAGALRSTDGGDTWTKIDPPSGLTSGGSNFVTHLHAPGGGTGSADRFVYANEADGKWITTNAGADGWTKVSTVGMAHGGSQIVYAPNGDLYMAGSVVQRSTDNGATWTTVSEAGVFSFLALGTDGTNLYTQVHNGGSFVRQAALPATTTGWSDLGTSRNGGSFVLYFDAPTGRLYANVSITADYGVWAYQFTPPAGEVAAEIANADGVALDAASLAGPVSAGSGIGSADGAAIDATPSVGAVSAVAEVAATDGGGINASPGVATAGAAGDCDATATDATASLGALSVVAGVGNAGAGALDGTVAAGAVSVAAGAGGAEGVAVEATSAVGAIEAQTGAGAADAAALGASPAVTVSAGIAAADSVAVDAAALAGILAITGGVAAADAAGIDAAGEVASAGVVAGIAQADAGGLNAAVLVSAATIAAEIATADTVALGATSTVQVGTAVAATDAAAVDGSPQAAAITVAAEVADAGARGIDATILGAAVVASADVASSDAGALDAVGLLDLVAQPAAAGATAIDAVSAVTAVEVATGLATMSALALDAVGTTPDPYTSVRSTITVAVSPGSQIVEAATPTSQIADWQPTLLEAA